MRFSLIAVTLSALAAIVWSSIYSQAEYLSSDKVTAVEAKSSNNLPINYYIDNSYSSR